MDAKTLGKAIADALLSRLAFYFGLGMITSVIFLYAITPKDNTDPPSGRSGLKLYTDNLTGVQYVGTRHGLTVRVDPDGRPIVVRK